MCDEAANGFLVLLKLISYWFIRRKMIKNIFTALYGDKNILYFKEDSANVVFSCNKMGIVRIELNNINLDNNFVEDDPDTIALIRL